MKVLEDRGGHTFTVCPLCVDYHRNGVAGAGFFAITFVVITEREEETTEQQMMAIIFGYREEGEETKVAVLDTDKLSRGDVAFGSNSWRAELYEPALFQFIDEHIKGKGWDD